MSTKSNHSSNYSTTSGSYSTSGSSYQTESESVYSTDSEYEVIKKRRKHSLLCLIILLVASLIMLAGVLYLGFFYLPQKIGWQSEGYLEFQKLKVDVKFLLYSEVPLKVKIWLYDIGRLTFYRPDKDIEVVRRLWVTEMGPWIYNKHVKRDEVDLDEKEVTFEEKYKYVYQGGESELQKIQPFFAPVWATLYELEDNPQGNYYLNRSLHPFDGYYRQNVFGSKNKYRFSGITAGDFMFNGFSYCGSLSSRFPSQRHLCSHILKPAARRTNNIATQDDTLIFSLFGHKQLRDPRRFTISTDPFNKYEKFGKISKIDGKKTYNVWKDDNCNKLRGTYNFFSHIPKVNDSFQVYIKDLCRPVTFKLAQHRVNDKGLPFRRYVLSKDSFDSTLPEKECYCNDNKNKPRNFTAANGCLRPGVQDLTKCKGIPWVASFPHLMHAHESFSTRLFGQKSEPSEHDSFIDINETNGSIITITIRYQMNFFLRSIPLASFLHKQWDITVPVYWIEQSIVLDRDLFEESLDDINRKKEKIPRTLDILAVVCLVLCIAAILVSLIWIIIITKRRCCKPKS